MIIIVCTKTLMKNRYLFLPLAALAFLSLPSCFKVNEDYGLDKEFDSTMKILGDFDLPVGNTETIHLGDIISIEEGTESFQIAENGDYVIHFSGSSISKSYDLPEFALDDFVSEPSTFTFAGGSLAAGTVSGQIPNMILDIKMDEEGLPEDVKDIRSADVNASISMHFALNGVNSGISFVIKEGSVIDFPDWVVISDWDKSGFDLVDSHKLSFKADYTVANGFPLDVQCTVNKLDFSKMPAGQGLVSPGKIHVEDAAVFSGAYMLIISAAGSYSSFNLSSQISFTDLDFVSATLVINPEIDIDVNRVDIGAVPEMFTEEGVELDIYDAYLYLQVNNTLPFSPALNASILTMDENLAQIGKVSVGSKFGADPFVIPASQQTTFCLSENGSGASGITDYKVAGLTSLVSRIPRYVDFEDLSISGSDDYVTIGLKNKCSFDVDYWIDAPLAFGENLKLVFENDAELGLDLSEIGISSLELTADFVNSIPLALGLEAAVYDEEGNTVPGLNLSVDGSLLPGSVEKPRSCPVSIKISCASGLIEELATLHFKFTASSPDPEYVGIALNENQGLKINNIVAHVKDGITLEL